MIGKSGLRSMQCASARDAVSAPPILYPILPSASVHLNFLLSLLQAFVGYHNATHAGTEAAATKSSLELRHQLVVPHGFGEPGTRSIENFIPNYMQMQ